MKTRTARFSKVSAGLLTRLGLIGFLVILVTRTSPAQPLLDAKHLEEAFATLRPAHSQVVEAFYAERGYRSLWTYTTDLLPTGRALLDALERAQDDGLDAADYVIAQSGTVEAREVALSDAFLRFARDLTQGSVDPWHVHRDWDANRRPFDAVAALRIAAERGPAEAFAAARPTHVDYVRLQEALARYRTIDDRGGWPVIPEGSSLHRGDSSSAVIILRARLRAEGYVIGSAEEGELFDSVLEASVGRAQTRLGLEADGIVGPATRAALNVTPAERVRQIQANMDRWRWMPAALGSRHIHVNAAGMSAVLIENGEAVLTLRAIVGTLSNPTPGFSSMITSAVFSPYWYVPTSIARNEILPRVQRDPGYLARNHMVVLSGGRIRQAPGPANPLGPVKFIFESRFDVRLHGTSNPSLFEAWRRAYSHGCIRVETPLILAERLLRGTEWDLARIDEVVSRGHEVSVPLAEPVPIHVSYWTAWVTTDGDVHFRADLYGRDRALERVFSERRR